MKEESIASSPLFQGILPFDRQGMWKDVMAGITLAALGIPEVMGYTRISQTPVITGLYTLVLPVIVFAIFGSSRHLVVAADSATAAMIAGALVHYATPYTRDYVALAGIVALLSAGMLVVARVFKLGLLADFLSRSALIGFLTGVGIQVAMGEFGSLLGIPEKGHSTLQQLLVPLANLGQIHAWTAVVGCSVVAIIILLRRFFPRFPGALVAVIGAIVASRVFDFERLGVATIGAIPSGLPHFVIPHAGWSHSPALLATAASCTIVIIAQSAATSRSYAMRYSDQFSENRDMIGLALANVGAAVSGTFIVNGSPTKTEMVDMAGGRSQVAQLATSGIILAVLLFLTKPLSFMPDVVLSAVVFLIGVKLIDLKGIRELFRCRRNEFWIAILTAITVAFVGVEQGILLAIAISLVDHLRVSYHPPTKLLKLTDSGEVIGVPVSTSQPITPGVLAYRFEAPLYYANCDFFMTEILRLAKPEGDLRYVIVRFDTISDVDYSASKVLGDLARRLAIRNIKLLLSDVTSEGRSKLDLYGLVKTLGEDSILTNFSDALRRTTSGAATAGKSS